MGAEHAHGALLCWRPYCCMSLPFIRKLDDLVNAYYRGDLPQLRPKKQCLLSKDAMIAQCDQDVFLCLVFSTSCHGSTGRHYQRSMAMLDTEREKVQDDRKA